ncbi:MAG: FHA domain-containing protein, partial [Phycisphaerae bacterium]
MSQSIMNARNLENAARDDKHPVIRLSVGRGTPGQKVWTLQHAATLVGAKRPANIVLHAPGIETSHFVILNTGRQILIRDLFTSTGTYVNNQPLRGVRCLHTGDVIRVADAALDVEIEGVNVGPAGAVEKAVGFSQSWGVCIDEDQLSWRLDTPVVVIGSHVDAPICLTHEKLSLRHAVLFPANGSVGVFDTGSSHGVWLNGERVSFALVGERDRLLIGPFTLRIVHIKPHDVFPPWDAETGERLVVRPPSSPFAKVQSNIEPVREAPPPQNNWEQLAHEVSGKDAGFTEAFVVSEASPPAG